MATAWNDEAIQAWEATQQRYWHTWSELLKNNEKTEFSPAQAWAEHTTQCLKSLHLPVPQTAVNDAVQRMLDMGKLYMSFAENAAKTQHDADIENAVTVEKVDAWIATLEATFRGYSQQLDSELMSTHGFGVGQVAAGNWQRVLKSLGMPAMPHLTPFGLSDSSPENWQEPLQKILATPALGLHRESQERWQQLSGLAANYQERLTAYLKAFAQQGLDAVDKLRQQICTLREQNKSIQSLRELYGLWVDANESTYAEFAMSDKYQSTYGEMINALMALKQGVNQELQEWYKVMGIPTQQDFNDALKKQQALRRENRELRQQLTTLNRKVEALLATQAIPSPVN